MPRAETALPQPVYLFAATAALAGLVAALATGELGLLAALVALPLVTAAVGSPRATTVSGAATLAVAVLAGLPHETFADAHTASLIAVAIAAVLAVALSNEREARERSADFSSFLADAGTLLSCSLDFDVTAKAVASVPVPELADWCLVELVSPDGAIERRAASHPDEGAEQVAAAVAAAGADSGGSRAELWRELPDDLLEAWAPEQEERIDSMRAVRASAAIRLPLRTAERLLGTMTLLARSPRRFREPDLRQAEELAARCSLAIENAQLYRAARRPSERRFGRRATDQPAVQRPEPSDAGE
jgi:hypothetical protein